MLEGVIIMVIGAMEQKRYEYLDQYSRDVAKLKAQRNQMKESVSSYLGVYHSGWIFLAVVIGVLCVIAYVTEGQTTAMYILEQSLVIYAIFIIGVLIARSSLIRDIEKRIARMSIIIERLATEEDLSQILLQIEKDANHSESPDIDSGHRAVADDSYQLYKGATGKNGGVYGAVEKWDD